MKKIILFMIFLITVSSHAQEVKINQNTKFKDLLVLQNGVLIMAIDNYIARSVDDGRNWRFVEEVGISKISRFLVRKADVLLMPDSAGEIVWRSKNKGLNWEAFGKAGNDSDLNSWGGSQAIDEDGNFYLCHVKNMYWTEDGGISWKRALSRVHIYGPDLCSEINVAAGIVYVRGRTSFSKSLNKGTTWDEIDIKEPYSEFNFRDIENVKITKQGDLYFLNRGIVYKSSDSGRTWMPEKLNKIDQPISHIDLIDGRIFVVGIAQAELDENKNPKVFYYRVGDGEIKNRINNFYSKTIQVDKSGNYYTLSRNEGPMKSEDNGETWHALLKPKQIFRLTRCPVQCSVKPNRSVRSAKFVQTRRGQALQSYFF